MKCKSFDVLMLFLCFCCCHLTGTVMAEEGGTTLQLIELSRLENLNLVTVSPANGPSNPVEGTIPGDRTASLASLAQSLGLECHIGKNLVLLGSQKFVDVASLGGVITLPSASDPMTCEFHEVDVRDLFRIVHQKTGLNLILKKSVRGRLTVRVTDLAAGTLVEAIVKVLGLECRQQGNIVFIGESQGFAEMLPPAGITASGAISLDFRDIDIRDVAKIIAQRFTRDFAAGANVRGNVTISLKNVAESEAMIGLARANGFDAAEVDGVWILADSREMKTLAESWKTPIPEPTTSISVDFRDAGVQGLVQIVSDKGGLPFPALLNPEARVTVRFTNRPADRIYNLLIKLGGGTL